MPAHPERVRTASLPEGYQFGQAGPTVDNYGFPVRPFTNNRDRAYSVLFVEMQHGTPTEIQAGIAELARTVSEGTFSAYARLEPITLAETWFYGPVRRIAIFSPFPVSGNPRMRHLLHIGLVDWTPFTTDRDLGDER